jgi:hypothetical protein
MIVRPFAMATFLVLAMTASRVAARADSQLTEAQARAGFLYNCALFVQWPAGVVHDELLLGIVGSDAVAALADTMDGRQVNGHTLRVKAVAPTDDLRGFHILYVGSAVHTNATLLASVRDQPVLTVGESNDFTGQGGVVRLYTDDQRLRFEINMTRVEHVGLQVSAKMLGLATIVR